MAAFSIHLQRKKTSKQFFNAQTLAENSLIVRNSLCDVNLQIMYTYILLYTISCHVTVGPLVP